MIYFDNAATSWPKPPEVKSAMVRFLDEIGANPGRSGHALSIMAARIIYEAREALSKLLNVQDPSRVIFTLNATESINLALKGLLRSGDHVLTSSMEHNSVMRPLRELEKRGVELGLVPCSETGDLDPEEIRRRIRSHTKLILLNHASNVTGKLLPVREVGKIAKSYGILFLVDAAQTTGAYPIDMERDGIDLLAFTGHKSLYGPQGTGGLVIGGNVKIQDLTPLKQGGTGSRSEFEEQPDFLPDRFESGTPNTVGIAGLLAGVQFVLRKGVETIRNHESDLIGRLMEKLRDIPKISLYGPKDPADKVAILSFNLKDHSPSEVATRLEEVSGILCRPGLHCAPAAHKTIGTFPEGTVRLSLGCFNSIEEIDQTVKTIEQIARKKK